MGKYFIDQYTLLHFAFGVVAYFFNVNLMTWFVAHTLFEIVENTPSAMKFVNTYLQGVWPGGKPFADSGLNSFGDTIFSVVGWLCAYGIDKYGRTHEWYNR